MSSLVNYTNKTSMIENKLKNLDSRALEMYNSNEYTPEEIEYFIKTSIVNILNTLGESSMQFRPALTVPVFEHYQSMVGESVDDLAAIVQDGIKLYETNKENAKENEILKTMVYSKVNFLKKNVEALEKSISSEITGKGFSSFNETFGSTENSSNVGGAAINMLSGTLTLGIKKQFGKNSYNIEILEGSDGYPGNTHQAVKKDGDVVFDGELELHADLNDIIDGNSDTWFEYEILELSEETIDKIASLGMEYNEGISWATDKKKINLNLLVTLKIASECNVMTINPFLSKIRGSVSSIIKKITVISEDKTSSQVVLNGVPFDTEQYVTFDNQEVKYVQIELEQTVPYETDIGHYFYGIKDEDTGKVSRTEGPAPSVSLLGLQYSPKTKTFAQPKGYDENEEKIILDDNKIKEELFGIQLKQDNCFKEIIPAKRYLIGIRDLDLSKQEYFEESVYLSKPFKVNEIINTVSLESSEYFPEAFGLKEKWITYSISFDDGKEWLPIYPRYRSHAGPSTYKINSMNMSSGNDGNVKYIYRLYEPKEVMVKITLKRPAVLNGHTPIVFSYNLSMRTGDEVLD